MDKLKSRGLARTVATLLCLAVLVSLLFIWCASSDSQYRQRSYSAERSETAERVSSPSPSTETGRNFVLAESYWEQMTCATRNFMGLVSVARHWNAGTVWPFTDESRLYGFPGPGRYTWDLLFNLSDVERECARMSLAAPVHFEDFLKTASRRVIVIIIEWEKEERWKLQKWKTNLINSLNSSLNATARHFKIESCCVVYNHQLTDGLTQIPRECGFRDNGSFTAVFKTWRGITYDKSKTFRLFIPPKFSSYDKYPQHFKHSKWVVGNTTAFFKDVTQGTGKCIAAHIRADKLLKFKHNIVKKCLENLNQTIKDLSINYTELMPILVFGDDKLGQIQNRLPNEAVVTHFIPQEYKAVVDKGFSAQVEQHTMSLCQILVAVGGGSFQLRTLARFNSEPSHLFSITQFAYQ